MSSHLAALILGGVASEVNISCPKYIGQLISSAVINCSSHLFIITDGPILRAFFLLPLPLLLLHYVNVSSGRSQPNPTTVYTPHLICSSRRRLCLSSSDPPTEYTKFPHASLSIYRSAIKSSRWRCTYVQIHNLPLLAAAHLSHNRFRHTHVGIAAAGCSKKVTLGQELLRRRICVNYANCSFLPITHSLTHHGSPAVTTTLGAAYKIFISRIMRELKQVEKWCIPSECI